MNQGDTKAEARFKEIGEANEVLSDPEKRKRYDELGADWQAYDVRAHGAPAAPGPGRVAVPGGVRVEFGEEVGGFSDFFRTFFGGGGFGDAFGGTARPTQGHDVEGTIEVTLEDVLQGHETHRPNGGKGGREVEVRVPPGVRDGSRLRVAGEGEAGHRGGPKGDLYLRVVVRPHPRLRAPGRGPRGHGQGAAFHGRSRRRDEVPTLDGPIGVKVPPGTAVGQTFRLRGQGLPRARQARQAGRPPRHGRGRPPEAAHSAAEGALRRASPERALIPLPRPVGTVTGDDGHKRLVIR